MGCFLSCEVFISLRFVAEGAAANLKIMPDDT